MLAFVDSMQSPTPCHLRDSELGIPFFPAHDLNASENSTVNSTPKVDIVTENGFVVIDDENRVVELGP